MGRLTYYPIKQTLTECWHIVGPPSATLAQQYAGIGSMYRLMGCAWEKNTADNRPIYNTTLAQKTRDNHPMLGQCWASVIDGGPTLDQPQVNFPCLFVGDARAAVCVSLIINGRLLKDDDTQLRY